MSRGVPVVASISRRLASTRQPRARLVPDWRPEVQLEGKTRVNVSNYGLDAFGDLFTPRQLVALTTFSDLVAEAQARVRRDAIAAGVPDDSTPLHDGGTGAKAYAEAVGVYLAFALDKIGDRCSTICGWDNTRDSIRNTFGRQAIPMVWDFAESNAFSGSTGSLSNAADQIARTIVLMPCGSKGLSGQADAQLQDLSADGVVSTDPPYYDNIGYADLSDFFYVWLRRSLRPVFPDLFATLAGAESRRIGCHSIPAWEQGKSRNIFSRWNDGGDALSRRTGASRLPGHHLLRLQAVREKRGRGHFQHWLGDLP